MMNTSGVYSKLRYSVANLRKKLEALALEAVSLGHVLGVIVTKPTCPYHCSGALHNSIVSRNLPGHTTAAVPCTLALCHETYLAIPLQRCPAH